MSRAPRHHIGSVFQPRHRRQFGPQESIATHKLFLFPAPRRLRTPAAPASAPRITPRITPRHASPSFGFRSLEQGRGDLITPASFCIPLPPTSLFSPRARALGSMRVCACVHRERPRPIDDSQFMVLMVAVRHPTPQKSRVQPQTLSTEPRKVALCFCRVVQLLLPRPLFFVDGSFFVVEDARGLRKGK
jgi:hypothetical protein